MGTIATASIFTFTGKTATTIQSTKYTVYLQQGHSALQLQIGATFVVNSLPAPCAMEMHIYKNVLFVQEKMRPQQLNVSSYQSGTRNIKQPFVFLREGGSGRAKSVCL
jgi:hypothetical protein